MAEGIPKTVSNEDGFHPPENAIEDIQRLRAEVKEFELRAAHPVPGAQKENFEPEVLSREAKIRELESLEKEKKIREQITELEEKYAHNTPGARKGANPEQEIVDLEDELRGLERKRKGIPEELEKGAVNEANEESGGDTLAEKREALRKAVKEVEAKNEFVGEMNEEADKGSILEATNAENQDKLNVENLKEMLADRSEELDAELEKIGGVEKGFRWLGEKYNTYGWKTKLATGLALGIGAGAAMTVSLPAAFVLFSGVAVQRAAGLSGMFLKYEKTTQEGKWQKEKAMGKAMLYTAAMTGAMLLLAEGAREGMEFVREHRGHVGEATQEWLKHHWPFSHPDAAAPAPGEAVVPPIHAPEVLHQYEAPPASAYAPVHAEMPTVSVEATQGHGYEYMVKRLWEQLQDKHLDPSKFAEDSDIHKLLTANAKTIDGVAHRIAMDPHHGFFNADGSSVQVNHGDHIGIGADGQIGFGDADYRDFSPHAPEGAHMTPAYHPEPVAEAPTAAAPVAEGSTTEAPTHPSNEAADALRNDIETEVNAHAEAVSSIQKNIEDATKPARDYQAVHTPVETTTSVPAETPATPEWAHTPTPETPKVETPVSHESVVNHFGIEVQKDVPHIYAGAEDKEFLVYGGSSEAQAKMAEAYIKEHPKDTVFGSSADGATRIKYLLGADGKVTVELPVKQSFWARLFSGTMFVGAPKPDELEKLIK